MERHVYANIKHAIYQYVPNTGTSTVDKIQKQTRDGNRRVDMDHKEYKKRIISNI